MNSKYGGHMGYQRLIKTMKSRGGGGGETTTLELTKTTTTITYKLLLTKINDKLKSLPSNTECEITVFFKKEIDDPSLMIIK